MINDYGNIDVTQLQLYQYKNLYYVLINKSHTDVNVLKVKIQEDNNRYRILMNDNKKHYIGLTTILFIDYNRALAYSYLLKRVINGTIKSNFYSVFKKYLRRIKRKEYENVDA